MGTFATTTYLAASLILARLPSPSSNDVGSKTSPIIPQDSLSLPSREGVVDSAKLGVAALALFTNAPNTNPLLPTQFILRNPCPAPTLHTVLQLLGVPESLHPAAICRAVELPHEMSLPFGTPQHSYLVDISFPKTYQGPFGEGRALLSGANFILTLPEGKIEDVRTFGALAQLRAFQLLEAKCLEVFEHYETFVDRASKNAPGITDGEKNAFCLAILDALDFSPGRISFAFSREDIETSSPGGSVTTHYNVPCVFIFDKNTRQGARVACVIQPPTSPHEKPMRKILIEQITVPAPAPNTPDRKEGEPTTPKPITPSRGRATVA